MVTETVVKEALSQGMIDAGKELTLHLDGADFDVSASLWFFNSESSSWRFMIASPRVGSSGVKAAYKKVQETLAKAHGSGVINLRDISLVSLNDPIIKLLKTAIKTGDGVGGMRFSRNLINGILIEDAYIYRLN